MDDFKQMAIESARDLAVMLARDFARGTGVSHWEQSSRFVAATNAISRLGQLVNMADQPGWATPEESLKLSAVRKRDKQSESKRAGKYVEVFADLESGYCMKSGSSGYIWRIWRSDKTNERGLQRWSIASLDWVEESSFLAEDICHIPFPGWIRCNNPETGASQ